MATVAEVVAHYDARAAEMAALHASVSFEAVHARLLATLPPPPATVLDVGSGIGRDAIALSAMGYDVVGVEPSARMLDAARFADQAHAVRWMSDRLPKLGVVRAAGLQFDLILCSAVLMHVEPTELAAALTGMRRLLAAGGRIAMTVRAPTRLDADELFFDHAPDEVAAAAATSGLVIVAGWRDLDVMRGDRWWDGYVLSER